MDDTNKVTTLSDEIRKKLKLRKDVKDLSDGGPWTITQIVLQDVQAEDEVLSAVNGAKIPLTEQITRMKTRIEEEFKDEPEVRDLLMQSVPTYTAIVRWTKTKEWAEAVMERIRSYHVFNNMNRAKVLDNILKVATSGGAVSIKAAELYFKLEGTLNPHKENSEVDDVFDRFKDLQQTLHGKK